MMETPSHRPHSPRTSVGSTWAHTRLFQGQAHSHPPATSSFDDSTWAARARQDPTR
jgi:hypothetical protein